MISSDVLAFEGYSMNGLARYYTLKQNRYLTILKGEGGHQLYSFEQCYGDMVEVGFNLGETVRCYPAHDAGEKQLHLIERDQVFMLQSASRMKLISEQPLYWIGVILPVEIARNFFSEALPAVDWDGMSMKPEEAICERLGSITTEMKVSLHQIVQCPFSDKTKRLFLESKVLELISHVRFALERIPDMSMRGASVNLTFEDREKMWQAKAFLDENLEVPPTITMLAQEVGVNEYKLKNGFRQVHGITPYRYIVEQRLERARGLLWNNEMNVTEAAFAVGYSSLSHFAKIFRDKFGVNPHEYVA